MLTHQLRDELKKSMLEHNELRKSVLRMLLSAITYFEIQKGGAGYEATDEDVLSVIEKQVKQRKDSIEQYEKAERMDLAEKEKQEMAMLEVYLPEQLSEDVITGIVKDAIQKTGATSLQDLGKVMGEVMPKVKGKADGTLVTRLVRENLQ